MLSLSHDTTWSSTAAECYAQTLGMLLRCAGLHTHLHYIRRLQRSFISTTFMYTFLREEKLKMQNRDPTATLTRSYRQLRFASPTSKYHYPLPVAPSPLPLPPLCFSSLSPLFAVCQTGLALPAPRPPSPSEDGLAPSGLPPPTPLHEHPLPRPHVSGPLPPANST